MDFLWPTACYCIVAWSAIGQTGCLNAVAQEECLKSGLFTEDCMLSSPNKQRLHPNQQGGEKVTEPLLSFPSPLEDEVAIFLFHLARNCLFRISRSNLPSQMHNGWLGGECQTRRVRSDTYFALFHIPFSPQREPAGRSENNPFLFQSLLFPKERI